jgi:hypothetical protein
VEQLTLMVTGFDVEGAVAVLRDELVGRVVVDALAGFEGPVRDTEADVEERLGTGLGW